MEGTILSVINYKIILREILHRCPFSWQKKDIREAYNHPLTAWQRE